MYQPAILIVVIVILLFSRHDWGVLQETKYTTQLLINVLLIISLSPMQLIRYFLLIFTTFYAFKLKKIRTYIRQNVRLKPKMTINGDSATDVLKVIINWHLIDYKSESKKLFRVQVVFRHRSTTCMSRYGCTDYKKRQLTEHAIRESDCLAPQSHPDNDDWPEWCCWLPLSGTINVYRMSRICQQANNLRLRWTVEFLEESFGNN